MKFQYDANDYDKLEFMIYAKSCIKATDERVRFFEWHEALTDEEAYARVPLNVLLNYMNHAADTSALIQLLRQEDARHVLRALTHMYWEGDNEVMRPWIKAVISALNSNVETASNQSVVIQDRAERLH